LAAYECIVQEGCTTLEQRDDLARELASIDEAILGAADDEITVEFIEMPLGSAFTGGQLSTTSIVTVEIHGRCSYEIRSRRRGSWRAARSPPNPEPRPSGSNVTRTRVTSTLESRHVPRQPPGPHAAAAGWDILGELGVLKMLLVILEHRSRRRTGP